MCPLLPRGHPATTGAGCDSGGRELGKHPQSSGHGEGQAGRTRRSDWASERRRQRAGGTASSARPRPLPPPLSPSVLGACTGTQPLQRYSPHGTPPAPAAARPGAGSASLQVDLLPLGALPAPTSSTSAPGTGRAGSPPDSACCGRALAADALAVFSRWTCGRQCLGEKRPATQKLGEPSRCTSSGVRGRGSLPPAPAARPRGGEMAPASPVACWWCCPP